MFSVSQETCGVATHTRGTGGSLGASAGLENAVVSCQPISRCLTYQECTGAFPALARR